MTLKKTLKKLEQAKADPDIGMTADDYVGLAEILVQKYDEKDAGYEALMLARERGKVNKRVYIGLTGYHYIAKNNYAEAARFMQEAIDRGFEDEDTISNLGLAYNSQSRFLDAIELFNSAIKRGFCNAEIFVNMSKSYFGLGRIHQAVEVLEHARRNNITSERTYHNLSAYYDRIGDLHKSVEIAEEAFEAGKITPEMSSALGLYLAETGKENDAIRIWETAVENDNANEEIFSNTGIFYFQRGAFDKVEEILETARSRNQMNASSYMNLSAVCYEKGQHIRSRLLMEEALERDLVNPELLVNLAMMYFFHDLNYSGFEKTILYALATGNTCAQTFVLMKDTGMIDAEKLHEELFQLTEKDGKDFSAYAYLSREAREYGEIYGRSSGDYLKQLINEMRKENRFITTPYLNSAHEIRLLSGGNLFDIMIVKEGFLVDGRNPFEEEYKNLINIDGYVGRYARFPSFVDSFIIQDRGYYIMEMEDGMTLTSCIKYHQIGEEEYENIIGTLAIIHAVMPKYNHEVYDPKSKIRNYLETAGYTPETENELEGIVQSLENSDYWGFSKDAHTDNWMMSHDETPIVLDMDEKGLVPCALDLASLLNCIPLYESVEERISAAEKYIEQYNIHAYRKINDINGFIFEYCNASVFRAIEKEGYFLSLGRQEDAVDVLDAGIDTIEYMQENGTIPVAQKKKYARVKYALEEHLAAISRNSS